MKTPRKKELATPAGCLGPSPSAEGPDPGGEAGYALVKPGKLTVVSDLANPPFDYYDSENVPAGFEVELMQAVAQKMGLESTISRRSSASISLSVS